MLQQFFTEVRDFIAAMQRAIVGIGNHLLALQQTKAEKTDLDQLSTVVQALEAEISTKLSATDLTTALDTQVPPRVEAALGQSALIVALQSAVSNVQGQITQLVGSVANTVGATFSFTFLNASPVNVQAALQALAQSTGTTLDAGKTYRLDVQNAGIFEFTDPLTNTPVSFGVTVGDFVNLKWDGTAVASYQVHDVTLTDDTNLGDLETFNPVDELRQIWIDAGLEVPAYYNV